MIFTNTADTFAYEDRIWELTKESDLDFVPPLSARNKTTQTKLNNTGTAASPDGPVTYFHEMLKQEFVLAEDHGELCGFLTYIPDHEIEGMGDYSPANYLSTIIVSKAKRNAGIAKKLYKRFIALSEGKNIVTRTWSTNTAHIHLLGKLGFVELKRIENDRGEGVDTIYYGKKNEK